MLVLKPEEILESVLKEKLKNNTLILPTLPGIAIKVRKAVEDPNIDIKKLTAIISTDIALSARIIKIANSAFLSRGICVKNTSQGIQRIGFNKIKTIATALAMEQLFVTADRQIQKLMHKIFLETLDIASSTIAIYSMYNERYPDNKIDINTLILASIVLRIGSLPILKESEAYPEFIENKSFLKQAIKNMGTSIGVQIIESWGFDPEIVKVLRFWELDKKLGDTLNYSDLVRIGAGVCGALSDPESVLQEALDRGIINNIDSRCCTEYLMHKESAREVFN
jgi:HD-like signal output (HDOD) protein